MTTEQRTGPTGPIFMAADAERCDGIVHRVELNKDMRCVMRRDHAEIGIPGCVHLTPTEHAYLMAPKWQHQRGEKPDDRPCRQDGCDGLLRGAYPSSLNFEGTWRQLCDTCGSTLDTNTVSFPMEPANA